LSSLHILVSSALQDFPWIVADEQEVHMEEAKLIPLKTMTSDILKVRLSQLSNFIGGKKYSRIIVVLIVLN